VIVDPGGDDQETHDGGALTPRSEPVKSHTFLPSSAISEHRCPPAHMAGPALRRGKRFGDV
jgi:hypothetical protein